VVGKQTGITRKRSRKLRNPDEDSSQSRRPRRAGYERYKLIGPANPGRGIPATKRKESEMRGGGGERKINSVGGYPA